MSLFKFTKLRNFISDIQTFYYVRKIIRKNKGTADWERFNLRVDWVYRIYTVFNPSPQDKGDDKQMMEIKMGERMIPCHKYIEEIGLGEFVGVSGEKIPETDSYLVVYYPMFSYLTTWRVFTRTLFIVILIIAHNPIINFFKYLWHLVF